MRESRCCRDCLYYIRISKIWGRCMHHRALALRGKLFMTHPNSGPYLAKHSNLRMSSQRACKKRFIDKKEMAMDKMSVTVDHTDWEGMIALMDRADEFRTMLLGKNSEDEDTIISINKNNITIETNQTNGWIRENIYHRDGTVEELFHGKWQ